MKIEVEVSDDCMFCRPRIRDLLDIIKEFENGTLPFKDAKLTIELNSDWLGGHHWHINRITLEPYNIGEKKK